MKETTKQKEQFKEELIKWSEASLATKFGNLPHAQQSRQMIKFFVLEVLEKLYPGIVPDDEGELESSIIDGSGDGGADFLYRTDDGQVLIIQAKYRGKDAPETPEAIGRVCDLQERLVLASQGKQQGIHKDLLDLAGAGGPPLNSPLKLGAPSFAFFWRRFSLSSQAFSARMDWIFKAWGSFLLMYVGAERGYPRPAVGSSSG